MIPPTPTVPAELLSLPRAPLQPVRPAAATGPLHVSADNPRYFSDSTGAIIYLTGSHTWSSFQDNGGSDPPPVFDYDAYLDFLAEHNHNFFRLWVWEQARWSVETDDDGYRFGPMPYRRVGPNLALDGKPRFDLTTFDQAYFDRLRERVIEARDRGIYVSVMLFDGWSVASAKGGYSENSPWRGHPFNAGNNINGIDGDTNHDQSGEEVHQLGNSAVTALQEAYVHKVIDTVNDLDNVLYEISNESAGGAQAWQYHMIGVVKTYEATKPKQHPVGMTSLWPNGQNADLYSSDADWISVNSDDAPADGSKVLLTDTDHICGVCGSRAWVWQTFTAGANPIFMDGYDGAGYGVGGAGFVPDDPVWVSLRRNMGYTLTYATRMNLATMTPRGDLASSGHCLANPAASGAEYLVYVPQGGTVSVDLSATAGELLVEWLDPSDGMTVAGASVAGGSTRLFTAPFSGDAVLYLRQPDASPPQGPYLPTVES